MNSRGNEQGFTLLEILIATTLLAVLGTLSAIALNSSLNTEVQLDQRFQQLQSLQRTQQRLQQDFIQMMPRRGRDSQGDEQTSPLVSSTDTGNPDIPLLDFFRNGRRLVGSQFPGSSLERVRYFFSQGSLIRSANTSLDPADAKHWREQVLLQDVQAVDLAFHHHGRWLNAWPLAGVSPQLLPEAIRVRLHIPRYGMVEQITLLPEAR